MAFCKIVPVFRAVTRRLACNVTAKRAYGDRRDVFSEISSALDKIDRRMRCIDKEINRLVEEVERSNPILIPGTFAPWTWGRIRNIPVERTKVKRTSKDRPQYQLELELPDMQPEDITVSLKDHTLKISARRDENKLDGSRCVRGYSYECSLPREVNSESVRSLFSDGLLTVEAPLPALEEPKESKEIEINVDT